MFISMFNKMEENTKLLNKSQENMQRNEEVNTGY